MSELSLEQAQLFRLLTSFFGGEQVIPLMTVFTICGGDFSEFEGRGASFDNWARKNRCLFTVVNYSDDPKLVVDFCASQNGVVDMEQLEKERILPELLSPLGIRYITISSGEFSELIDGEAGTTLTSILAKKIGVLTTADEVNDR